MFNFFKTKKSYKSISPQEVKNLIDAKKPFLLIDVRSPEEYKSIRISNSISVPLINLKFGIEKAAPDKDAELILYCQSGLRSAAACKELVKMGYTNVSNLGGITSWPYEKTKG